MTSFNWKTSKSPIIHGCLCLDRNNCHGCSRYEQHKSNVYPPPKVNADRVRAMSDEEIEAWYWWMHKEMMRYTDSRVFLHDWLRQEAE